MIFRSEQNWTMMLLLGAISMMLSWGVTPVLAGIGDPSANLLEANAGPGETTQRVCLPNGFYKVNFFKPRGNLVSSIESSTPCTSGSSSSSQSSQAHVHAANDTMVQILNDLFRFRTGAFWAQPFGASAVPEPQSSNVKPNTVRLVEAEAVDVQIRQDLKAAEAKLAQHKARVARELAKAKADLARAEAQLYAARSDYVALSEGYEGPAIRPIDEVSKDLDELPEKLRYLRDKIASLELDAEGRHLQFEVSAMKTELANNQVTITNLKNAISAAEGASSGANNQLAGSAPSPGTFEALRAQGIELFFHGTYLSATDKQRGQNLDIDAGGIAGGILVRVSERLAAGVSASAARADSDDKNGAGVSTESKILAIAPFLIYEFAEGIAVDANLGYAYTDNDITRTGGVTGDYSSDAFSIGFGLNGTRQVAEDVIATGRLGYSHVFIENDGYTDSGGTSVASTDEDRAALSLSGRLDYRPEPDWRLFAGASLNYDMIERLGVDDRVDTELSLGAEYTYGSVSILGQVGVNAFRDNFDATTIGIQVRMPL